MKKRMGAHWSLKLLAIAMLYVFFGHPNIYRELWRRKAWLPLIAAAFTVPVGTYECLRVLYIRLTLNDRGFSLRAPLGTVTKHFSEIASTERLRGEVAVHLRDSGRVRIPWLVGNLDYVQNTLRARIKRE